MFTRAVGWGARRRLPKPVRGPLYSTFARCVGARLDEVELPLEAYPTLGSFFARRLRPGARPTEHAPKAVVAPCDGVLARAGSADGDELIQAKGHRYSIEELVADTSLASELRGASYLTIYLSPRDYHRVHSPVDGGIAGYTYVPGRLFPVSPPFVASVPNLFSRNERVVFEIRTRFGAAALVMVGATGVGNIGLTYPGVDSVPVESRRFRGDSGVHRCRHNEPIPIEQGQELGAFHLGSTVVLLLPQELAITASEGGAIRFGEKIGALDATGGDR